MESDKYSVVNDVEHSRFLVRAEGSEAELKYSMSRSDRIDFLHTKVPSKLEGQGIGKLLARTGLSYARENGFVVRPYCPFVRSYIKSHPDFGNLVEPGFKIKRKHH